MRKRPSTANGLAVTAVATLTLVLAGGPAFAHKLKVFATAEGPMISGYVYFPGGGRAKGVTVVAQATSGARLGEAVTNAKGEFAYQATVRCDHRLVADSGDGHRATFLIEAADLPDSLPAPAASTPQAVAKASEPAPEPPTATPLAPPDALKQMLVEVVSRHVRPLREQLERAEEKRRLHDILGGIGYILGLTGLAFYFLGVRRRGGP